MLTIADIIPKEGELPFMPDNAFRELRRIASQLYYDGPVCNADLEKLSYIKVFHPVIFQEYEKHLMYSLGLFYKISDPETVLDLAFNTIAKAIKLEMGDSFTPIQASAYRQINGNKYFSFSAPTSAGKSHLFRKLIEDEIGDIIIVLPSRALIAEYLYSVREALRDRHDILVLQFIENINQAKTTRRVYIVTPERCKDLFKELRNGINVSLIMFDEAQMSEDSIRGIRFDSLVRRIDRAIPQAKIIFTHPFINNPEAQLQKHEAIFQGDSNALTYQQNVVGKIFVFRDENTFSYFSPYETIKRKQFPIIQGDIVSTILKRNGTVLIYVSKNSIYTRTFKGKYQTYIDICPYITDTNALTIIDELKDYLGVSTLDDAEKYSLLVDLMLRGVVIHHGSIPLRARLLIENFVKAGYARICFATSTLLQGINMPFDVVWIDNFRFDGGSSKIIDDENFKALALKNLIGRAGRTSHQKNNFEYGYVIIEKRNLGKFTKRLDITPIISNQSRLDDEIDTIPEDYKDIVEAIKNNTFNDEANLANSQLERLSSAEVMSNIEYILDSLFIDNSIISGDEYYQLTEYRKRQLREAFKYIFIAHMRRNTLTIAEQSVLSTAIPILLWQIRGKSFKEIISLRYRFLAEKVQQKEIETQKNNGVISEVEAEAWIDSLMVRYTAVASPIPNVKLRGSNLFYSTKVREIDYDRIVFDTYDYIDKVISLSLADPLCAACSIYYDRSQDVRAKIMCNYLKYGTNDEKEIWLLKYGFTFEDMEWLNDLVLSIDERQIVFSPEIINLEVFKRDLVRRYE